ncbi:MAG TPA: hypothetical protein VD994_06895 [Prosthecobacter sp.]|nr:hypothetical protein [Prosthecobacter sp.]
MNPVSHRDIPTWQIVVGMVFLCTGSLAVWVFWDSSVRGFAKEQAPDNFSALTVADPGSNRLSSELAGEEIISQPAQAIQKKGAANAMTSPLANQSKTSDSDDSADERLKSLNRDMTTSEQLPDDLRSTSDRVLQDIEKALISLRKAIIQSELRRCQFETKEFPEAAYARVVISAPSPGEAQDFQRLLETSALAMAEDVRDTYLVEGQRLIDRYLHFVSPYIVLMTAIPNQGRMVYNKETAAYEMLNDFGSYAAFSTRNPQNYHISDVLLPDGGRFHVPESMRATMKIRPWFDGNGQPARFKHLFKGLSPESVEL